MGMNKEATKEPSHGREALRFLESAVDSGGLRLVALNQYPFDYEHAKSPYIVGF